ncbi:MAG: DUF72 domain-containing protein [Gammaproteobacteria bacterium]
MSAPGRIRVGTSGYQCEHWREHFYPRGLARTRMLAHYCTQFDALEIDNTFYSLPGSATFRRWRATAPRGFRFALKLSRYASHMKKLADPAATLSRFLDALTQLGAYTGPVLVQLAPRWRRDVVRLDAFLAACPGRFRWAVELRDPSWLDDDVFALLERHRAALVIHDLLPQHPRVVTTDFVCCRYHGEDHAGRYAYQKLAADARWLDALRARHRCLGASSTTMPPAPRWRTHGHSRAISGRTERAGLNGCACGPRPDALRGMSRNAARRPGMRVAPLRGRHRDTRSSERMHVTSLAGSTQQRPEDEPGNTPPELPPGGPAGTPPELPSRQPDENPAQPPLEVPGEQPHELPLEPPGHVPEPGTRLLGGHVPGRAAAG